MSLVEWPLKRPWVVLVALAVVTLVLGAFLQAGIEWFRRRLCASTHRASVPEASTVPEQTHVQAHASPV